MFMILQAREITYLKENCLRNKKKKNQTYGPYRAVNITKNTHSDTSIVKVCM